MRSLCVLFVSRNDIRPLKYVYLTLGVFAVMLGSMFPFLIDASSSSSNENFLCNCDYCNATKVEAIEDDVDVNNTTEDDNEDFDGDGDRTICARDRDEPDRSFSSICHMLCHNNCTRYRIRMYMKTYTASVFRTNYYKLKDGPC